MGEGDEPARATVGGELAVEDDADAIAEVAELKVVPYFLLNEVLSVGEVDGIADVATPELIVEAAI